ncbi:MAG: chromosome segregation protein SMC [Melioribacteraceae bacterium]|nr:chromosome segregation protein SMC [Melioribacteraceae bacterium]
MYLSKLEIFGFKSFANKTVINFNRGITGIVGPNGCGKTNIIDAIRWVLGEQKSSTLRSDKMESVIFNGTRGKKPMGMSEASLTLVNDKGILPTEYSEVTITRRIFRSGESEYLLNKNICRLKDITNLFMDTGMGTNAYSVIELKMIDTILSSKADERRHMFEEAAGVNKYKLRRRLTLKRLEDVKSDLVRVNDIVSEVDKVVNSLRRQAKKADKHNQITSILREKEIDLAEREFSNFTTLLNELNDSKSINETKKEQIDLDTRKIETELIQFRDKTSTIEDELNIKSRELSENINELHERQRKISVTEERDKVLQRNLSNYKAELTELESQIFENEERISNHQEELISFEELIGEKEVGLEDNQEELSLKRDELESYRLIAKEDAEKVRAIEKEISTIENQIENNKTSLERTNRDINKFEQIIQNTTSDIAKTVGYLDELTQEKEDVEQRIVESDSEFLQKEKEKEELESSLSNLYSKELEAKNIISGVQNKIELLQSLITNLEGISKGSKVLLENSSWSNGERTIIADAGDTKEEYRLALNAALKDVLNNLFIEQVDELNKAINYLKKNNLGKASFYLLDMPSNGTGFINKIIAYEKKRKSNKLSSEQLFIDWANELVITDTKWKPYFDKLLSNIAGTKDLEAAIELHSKYPKFSFVTLEGDFVKNDGIIEAGSAPQLDETLFGRKQHLDNLKKEAPRYESNLIDITNEIRLTKESIAQINLKDLSDRGKTLLNEKTNIEKQIAQIEFKKERAYEEVENTQKKINELVIEANKYSNIVDELGNSIDSVKVNLEKAKIQFELKETEQREKEDAYNLFYTAYNQTKLELERTRGQLSNAKASIKRGEEQRETINNSITKRKLDIEKTDEELYSLQSIIDESQIEYDELNFTRDTLLSEEGEIKNRLSQIKEESAHLESSLSKFRNERQQVSDEIHADAVKVSEYNLRLENLIQHISEEYSINLEFKEFDNSEFNFREVSSEVHSLKQQVKNLGPVNLLAYSEYEEENERLEFLTSQRDDLISSEKDLIETIDDINEAAKNIFTETFEAIRINFKKIFRSLFDDGDEADLMLEDGVDPLEAKIEIVAKPKGKRPSSIEQLSGGEKTLTATALLFAIYLVKPSPFCIMDEVDAPLDDANIDRFANLLSDFSDNTQFIIVTHNKRTMNSAETMYGVTMQEEGISKLAGVRFTEEVKV